MGQKNEFQRGGNASAFRGHSPLQTVGRKEGGGGNQERPGICLNCTRKRRGRATNDGPARGAPEL